MDDAGSYMLEGRVLTPPAHLFEPGGAGPAGVHVSGLPLQGHHDVRDPFLHVYHCSPSGHLGLEGVGAGDGLGQRALDGPRLLVADPRA